MDELRGWDRKMLAPRGLVLGLLLAFAASLTSAAAIGAAPVGAQDLDEGLTIPLEEYEGSGMSGTATLTAEGQGVRVAIEIEGDGMNGESRPHIHAGTCDDFDPSPLYPLTFIVLNPLDAKGRSETTVEAISLDELLADDHVILVHESIEELPTYLVCGEIASSQESAPGVVTPSPSGGVGGVGGVGGDEMPVTGVGPIGGGDEGFGVMVGLGFLALALAGLGVWLRRSEA